MGKLKWCFVILFSMCFLLMGCYYQQSSEEKREMKVIEYETKIVEGKSDKNVKIRQLHNEGFGQVEIEFAEKEIPFEMRVHCGVGTYEGSITVSGSLGDGEITTTFLTEDNQIVWEKAFSSKFYGTVAGFDVYSGEYILRIGFNDVKKGRVKVKFKSVSVSEE